ncbi:MAG: hypothetical protein RR458_05220 [Clostridia bacterium]
MDKLTQLRKSEYMDEDGIKDFERQDFEKETEKKSYRDEYKEFYSDIKLDIKEDW